MTSQRLVDKPRRGKQGLTLVLRSSQSKDTWAIRPTPYTGRAWERTCMRSSQFLQAPLWRRGCDLKGEILKRPRPWRILNEYKRSNQPTSSLEMEVSEEPKNTLRVSFMSAGLRNYHASSEQCQSNKNFLVLFASFFSWLLPTNSCPHLFTKYSLCPISPLFPW